MRKINSRKKDPKYPRICMITGPLPDSIIAADVVHISSLLLLLEPWAEERFIISSNLPENIFSGDKIHVRNIKHCSGSRWMFIRIPMYLIWELKISYQLIKISKAIDIVFFSIGAVGMVLPMVSAKLMRKKTIFIYPGKDTLRISSELGYRDNLFGFGGQIYSLITGIMEMFSCSFSDKIIANSSSIAKFVLKRYIKKILIISRFFVNHNNFKIEKDISSRRTLVGYIGKFAKVKGTINFIRAIPLISEGVDRVKFIICGDVPSLIYREGTVRDTIRAIKDSKLGDIVTFTGWVPYNKLPDYLNEIKLIVIPSYYEVGPQLLVEAMACGTPVLATEVGIVPDVISDGENGFIMENNSPECIAKNVVRALNYPDLDRIVKNARELIEEEYNYDTAAERYRKIFENIGDVKK